MLAYFPTVYPGELLYSVLARYHQHVGLPGPMHTLDALFGNRKVIATFDLPGHLQSLVDRIPPERELGVAYAIKKLTLFPYFTAFEPPELQDKVFSAMSSGTIDGLHVRLGLSAFRVGRNQRFRFCRECVLEMAATCGELWWRRDHQLPGVLVCPIHACLLQESRVSVHQFSRHEFVAATSENCPSHAQPAVSAVDQVCLTHLHRLAQRSADLLINPPDGRTMSGWTMFYRSKMLEVGLAKSASTMHQRNFEIEFRNFYGRTLNLLPSVMDGDDFSGDWLASMVRKHRKANHPFLHILVQDFLVQRPIRFSPFGSGPWPCINPLSSHSSKLPIKTLTQHSNAGNRVGVFSCSCGYVYTRCLHSKTGHLGLPRFLQYGPLLEPVLRNLVTQGVGLRKIGRSLRLDPKTVVRLAGELGLTITWKSNHSFKTKNALIKVAGTAELFDMHLRKNMPSIPTLSDLRKSTRRDWENIDNVWFSKLSNLIPQVLREDPPVRVSVAELERRVNRRGWILKRQHRMPKTMTLLKQTIEKTEDFQFRRIQWAIAELELCGGQVKAWQVMRKCGLRTNCLERISALLCASPIPLRVAV